MPVDPLMLLMNFSWTSKFSKNKIWKSAYWKSGFSRYSSKKGIFDLFTGLPEWIRYFLRVTASLLFGASSVLTLIADPCLLFSSSSSLFCLFCFYFIIFPLSPSLDGVLFCARAPAAFSRVVKSSSFVSIWLRTHSIPFSFSLLQLSSIFPIFYFVFRRRRNN